MKPLPRILALFLSLVIALPNPAFALRTEASKEAGAEEQLQLALADPTDPVSATARMITHRLASTLGIPETPAVSQLAAGAEEIDSEVKQLIQKVYQVSELQDQAAILSEKASAGLSSAQWRELVDLMAGLRRYRSAQAPRLFAWLTTQPDYQWIARQMIRFAVTNDSPWTIDAVNRLIEAIPDDASMARTIEETAGIVRDFGFRPDQPESVHAAGLLIGLDQILRFDRLYRRWYLPQILKYPKDSLLRSQLADHYAAWSDIYLIQGQPAQPYYSLYKTLAALEMFKTGLLRGEKENKQLLQEKVMGTYNDVNGFIGGFFLESQPNRRAEEEALAMRLQLARPVAEFLELMGEKDRPDYQKVIETISRAEDRIRQMDQNLLAQLGLPAAGAEEHLGPYVKENPTVPFPPGFEDGLKHAIFSDVMNAWLDMGRPPTPAAIASVIRAHLTVPKHAPLPPGQGVADLARDIQWRTDQKGVERVPEEQQALLDYIGNLSIMTTAGAEEIGQAIRQAQFESANPTTQAHILYNEATLAVLFLLRLPESALSPNIAVVDPARLAALTAIAESAGFPREDVGLWVFRYVVLYDPQKKGDIQRATRVAENRIAERLPGVQPVSIFTLPDALNEFGTRLKTILESFGLTFQGGTLDNSVISALYQVTQA